MKALSSALMGALVFLCLGCPGPDDPSNEWEPIPELEAAGWLLSVWGPAPDDLYAVGGSPTEGAIMHFDGVAWTPLSIGVDVPLLNWVHGFGPDDITVVGNGGTVIHWDGTGWTEQATPTDEDLWGVWGASPNDLWAVGGRGREEGQATILRYDGSLWTQVPTPTLMRPRVFAFFKVWGSSANDVVIVGQRGVLLRWDGSALNEELVGTSDDLISVWGTGPDRVAAVGGRSNGVISVWNGTEWRTESLAPVAGLNGVWMRDPGVVHVVGIDSTTAVVDFETLEYTDEPLGRREALHAVFGDSSGRLTAVGGNLSNPMGPYMGIGFTRTMSDDE